MPGSPSKPSQGKPAVQGEDLPAWMPLGRNWYGVWNHQLGCEMPGVGCDRVCPVFLPESLGGQPTGTQSKPAQQRNGSGFLRPKPHFFLSGRQGLCRCRAVGLGQARDTGCTGHFAGTAAGGKQGGRALSSRSGRHPFQHRTPVWALSGFDQERERLDQRPHLSGRRPGDPSVRFSLRKLGMGNVANIQKH